MKPEEMILYPFTAPLVFPSQSGWKQTPKMIMQSITTDRFIQVMKNEKIEQCTNAEACLYLMNASLNAPLNYDYVQIYLYVATKVIGEKNVPKDIRVTKLTDWQKQRLKRLKYDICNRVMKEFKKQLKKKKVKG